MKKIRVWLALGLVGTFAILLILPTAMSSRWIYEPLLERLKAGDFQVAIGSARLRWFSPLIFQDITVDEANGTPLLHIDQIRTDRGLLSMMWNGRRIGELTIRKPQVEIALITEGSNLDRLVEALRRQHPLDAERPKPPALDFDLTIEDLSVRVTHENQAEPLVVVPPADLKLEYTAADRSSKVHIEPAQLLDNVQLTPELMQLGLEYAVPFLAKSAWFEGQVSLTTEAIDLYLDDLPSSTGKATLHLHEVRSGPTEPEVLKMLDWIALLRKQKPEHELVFMDGTAIEIELREERVHHRGLKLGLPKIDPRLQLESSGSVGTSTRDLDMQIEVPVPIEILARRESVKQLGIPTITVPLRGQLDDPKVEWSVLRQEGADLLGAIGDQLGDEAPRAKAILEGLEGVADGQADKAISSALDLIRAIREGRQKERDEQSQEGDRQPVEIDPADAAKDKETERPVLDTLKNLLRRKK